MLEGNLLVRLHLNAEQTHIRHDDDEIYFRPQTSIPRSQIERMQRHPVVGAGREHVEHVTLPGGCAVVDEGRNQTRHCSIESRSQMAFNMVSGTRKPSSM